MDIRKDIIDKYLNTKKNRIIAGCVTGLIVLGCGGGNVMFYYYIGGFL